MSSGGDSRSPARRSPRPPLREAESAPAGLRILHIGYGNLVLASRVIAILSPQSAPMRRLREEASRRGKLLDATHGRRTRSILITDSDHVVLSAVHPETVAARLEESTGGGEGGR